MGGCTAARPHLRKETAHLRLGGQFLFIHHQFQIGHFITPWRLSGSADGISGIDGSQMLFFAQQCKNRRDGLNDFTIQLVQVTRWQHRLIDHLDLLGMVTAERFGFVELITELRVSQFFIRCPRKQTTAIVINRRSIIFPSRTITSKLFSWRSSLPIKASNASI